MDVNPLTKYEISFSKDYKKVPIAIIDGKQVNDSSEIIKELISVLRVEGTLPADFKGFDDPEMAKWLEYCDKRLAVLLFPNITRTAMESWEAFGYVNSVPTFSLPQKFLLRLTGSVAMRLANSKIKKKYKIDDERSALLSVVSEWVTEGLRSRNFHGGDSPDLADVVVFGALKSVSNFTTFEWLTGASDRSFLVWYNSMNSLVVRQ